MKKIIFAIFCTLMLMTITICQSEASTTYELVFTNINYGAINDADKIAGFESNIVGGDWQVGTISSPYESAWFIDNLSSSGGTFFGGADDSDTQDVWLENGIFATIISLNDNPLSIINMDPYKYSNGGASYTGAYTAQLNPTAAVPIPGALWLLGSGLIGMVGVRRKLNKS